MAVFNLTYENPETRGMRFSDQLKKGCIPDGKKLSATQIAYRLGYLHGIKNEERYIKRSPESAHPSAYATQYAHELKTKIDETTGASLNNEQLSFRSGYLQYMKDAAKAWKESQNADSNKSELLTLFNKLNPQQQASLIGYAKGMLANSDKNLNKLINSNNKNK